MPPHFHREDSERYSKKASHTAATPPYKSQLKLSKEITFCWNNTILLKQNLLRECVNLNKTLLKIGKKKKVFRQLK